MLFDNPSDSLRSGQYSRKCGIDDLFLVGFRRWRAFFGRRSGLRLRSWRRRRGRGRRDVRSEGIMCATSGGLEWNRGSVSDGHILEPRCHGYRIS